MNPDSRIELGPDELFRLTVFLVERGQVKAAADVLLAALPSADGVPACDCGHEGLDAMFHLTPCPVALLRSTARKLGYDLALIPREDA
jgi:hypothetical protein